MVARGWGCECVPSRWKPGEPDAGDHEGLCWRMTFLMESGRNAPQMEVKLPQHGPGFGDHQAQIHSLCHSPTKSEGPPAQPNPTRLHGKGFFGAERRIRRGGSGVDVEWGRLRRPGRRGAGVHPTRTRATHNTRRPRPAQPFPRPYGDEGASQAT
jgi:hypothetical protein